MSARPQTNERQGTTPASGDRFRLAVSTGLWTGLSPRAPGTCGTLPGVLIHLSIAFLAPPALVRPLLLACFLLACIASLRLAPWAIAYWRSDDPRHFVLDEVAGYLLTIFLLVPPAGPLPAAAWGFLLFRLFDAVKPPPVGWIDRGMKGPWGILLDDLAAAVMASAGLYLLRLVAAHAGSLAAWLPGPV
jgi:phosphatidylglycerophosphatase A